MKEKESTRKVARSRMKRTDLSECYKERGKEIVEVEKDKYIILILN